MRNLICTGAAVAAALVVMMLPGVTMVAHAAGEGTSAESPILIGPATGVLVESGTLAVNVEK